MSLGGETVHYETGAYVNESGKKTVTWNGDNGHGKQKAGMYVCKIKLNMENGSEEKYLRIFVK